MWRHSTWCHLLQSSHATPLSFHVTALAHTWHGYLGVLGPGLVSISDEFVSINRARYKRVCWVRSFTNRIQFKLLCLAMSLILKSKGSNDLLAFPRDFSWLFNLFHNIQDSNPRKNKDFILMIFIVYIDDFPRRKLSYLMQLYNIFDDRGYYRQSKSVWLLLGL